MRANKLLNILIVVILLLTTSLATVVPSVARGPRPRVREAGRVVTSRPLRHIPPTPPVVYEVRQIERKMLPNRLGSVGPSGEDPVWQAPSAGPSALGTIVNFEGVNNRNFVLPPDTDGDVGPSHYVQMINLSFAIYDKSGNRLYGPANNNTLWSQLGGPCADTNNGDPIVLYDQLADRWLMSQFALPNYPSGPFYQCIAISQTPDPTGAWHLYEFMISNHKLNDYPKFGVWPDGYYMSINQFTCNIFTCTWAGQGVVSFERDKMLVGDPSARMVYFDLFSQDPDLGGMLPADWDGTAQPPTGAPNYFVQVDDDAWGGWPDQLQVWEFAVDWASPSSSTFTFAQSLDTAPFDSNVCGYSRNCVPQPGGTKVDAISDRLMFRLQYRNLGSHQAMVANHTVDVNGADHAGIRWYELRNGGSGWSIYQQGTYAPDSDHRWMGSMAMNSAGDIALGYSVSSTSTSPSIRFTGRLDGDPPGQMTQGEGAIINGSGYQMHSSGRWGDYSAMAVDPVDDCTFWYTQEYYASANPLLPNWQTRVGSFRLRNCGPVDNPPAVNITNPTEGATVSGTIDITADASDDNGVTQVEFFVNGGSIGVDTDAPYAVSWDSTSVPDGDHKITATATDTIGQTANDAVNVTVDNVNEPPVTLHVGDLDGSSADAPRGRWEATVTITVHNNNEGGVSGALVEGDWGGGAQGGGSCTTDATGLCSVTKGNLKANLASVTFSVSNITSGAGAYVAGDNHDPDGDSDGATITVNKPGSNTPPDVTITVPIDGATFASGATINFAGTATDAEDGDLTASLVWTSSIDGQIGTGGSFSAVLSDGAHSITAEATDSGGATGSDSIGITVGTVVAVVMHVGDLDGSSAAAPRNRWNATVTITVHDASENPVANATVSGSWSVGGGGSCTTDAAGQCNVTKNNIKDREASATFTVAEVTRHAGDVYDSGANHDPDGDSDGTSITILNPQ